MNATYPAEVTEPMLSNDNDHNENNNKPICKTECPKLITGVYHKSSPTA